MGSLEVWQLLALLQTGDCTVRMVCEPQRAATCPRVQRGSAEGAFSCSCLPSFYQKEKKKKKEKEKKKKKKPVNVASCVCNAYFLLFPLRLVMSLSLFRNGC